MTETQIGTWLLIAPDGRRFEAETPLQCASNELRDRVSASVALERLMHESDDNEMTEFNINSYCFVRLTEIGREERKRQYDKLNRQFHGNLGEYKPKKEHDGWSKWQMHHLMNTFGHMLTNCDPIPFEPTIRLEK